MDNQDKIVYGVMLLMALFTSYTLILPNQDNGSQMSVLGSYERFIWTDKETYELGETVESAIIFINKGDELLEITPINVFYFSGNSLYSPEQITGSVFLDYAPDVKITILANGNLTFIAGSWTPTYPGPFKITGLGISKTVNVTGYKEVSLNSTGISLIIEPSKPVLKDKENVEFSLVIVNDNPFPVKIPVFDKLEYGFVQGEIIGGIKPDWVIAFFRVEAYSQTTMWSHSFRVGYPSFSLYVYVDEYTASLLKEVVK